MTARLLVPVTLFLALACGGAGTPVVEAPPQPVEVKPPEPVALDGYAYVPGPDGGARGARFSRFASGDAVFVGVDDANLRDPNGSDDVVAKLRLGSKVTVEEVLGEPVELIDRLNVWYRVKTEDGQVGRLFGGLLTPFGGKSYLSEGDEGERGWAVTFAPDGSPRVRIDEEPGSDESFTIDLEVTERFRGGRLEAEVQSWGDFVSEIQVTLCRLDGGEAPECSSGAARFGGDSDALLVQVTPPDPWRYALDPTASTECAGGAGLDVTLDQGGEEAVVTLQTPQYMRGDDGTVECYAIGRVKSGKHSGKELVSCIGEDGGKSGPSMASVARYLRDSTSWTLLPCASDWKSDDVHAALVEKRLKVLVDPMVNAPERLAAPTELPVSKGHSTLRWRAPGGGLDAAEPLFTTPGGQVLSAPESNWSVPGNALVVHQPDGTALVYDWQPDLSWSGNPPSDKAYSVQTDGCDGSPEILLNLEPEISDEDVEPAAKLADGTAVVRLKDREHPVSQRLLGLYASYADKDEYERPRELELGLSVDDLLAGNPWLFVKDPWGRYVRLMREDFAAPAMCEPILYVYADPPEPVSIAPVAPLRFFRTDPFGPDGWSGVAQPDGSVVIGGERHAELFWEGRGYWFRAPEDATVVAAADVEPFLRGALAAQGLEGREIEAFLNAWLPDLEGYDAVRIGFHDLALIEAVAPLDIRPVPDTLVRVLMDAAPTDEPPDWDGRQAVFSGPRREGLVVVEWGGLLRRPRAR
ncbi:MAG: SH3 domain-containing protein [Alphaproteobacteria bacterium]|nr:SH3 domain-containing protein [Alphaproteobacteria bacterium]